MAFQAGAVLGRPVIVAEIEIRPCRAEDLQQLEWYGLFGDQRKLFNTAFARHLQGENPMLVADLGGFPVGQAWIDLAQNAGERVGVIWAVRVFPFLRGLGIGTRLIETAEDLARRHGCQWAEISVEPNNSDARRLWERLGYAYIRQAAEEFEVTNPEGVVARHVADQFVLRKSLT